MFTSLSHACTALSAVALLLMPSFASATTVEAVTFEELVKNAHRIFVGEVVAVESFRADIGRGPRIRTRVTFVVDDALRGAGAAVRLEFLGGTVGDLTLDVTGMPDLIVGERYVIFARDGDRWVNPVVGFTQGVFPISRDARDGTLRVLTAGRAPLTGTAAIGQPSTVSRTLTDPMTLAAFLSEIRTEMMRQRR